jgi:hypothetical protein
MAKSIEDFREDLKLIRDELYQGAETMDLRILASYIDRLIISLDALADSIEGMEISMEELSTADECECCAAPAKKPAKKAMKKAKPKAGKKKRK